MKLSNRIKKAYDSITKRSLGNSLGAVIRNYASESTFRPEEQLKGITYKAIDKIGLSLSIYEPIVIRKTDGSAVANHPLYNLYHDPSPNLTASDFIHLYGMYFEIYGETFWYKAKGEVSNKIKELYLLDPAQVELKIAEGEVIGYVLHKSDGTQVPFDTSEIYHDKRPNPFNPWRGMSVMEKASVYIDTEINTSTFTLNYIKNNASPSGIVSLPSMTKEAFQQFTQRWREGYEGPQNAGKTAFIRGGEADFKAVGATLKDIDQEVTRKMSKDDVLMMLELPKELLGMTNDSGFGRSTIEAFSYIFSKEKLEPMMRRLDRIYESMIPELTGRDNSVEVDHESPIPQDKEYQLNRQKAGTNVWITVNESRAIDGLPPIPGGDDLTIGNQSKVVEQKSKKIVLKKTLTKAEQLKKELDDKEAFRKDLVRINEVYEKKVKREISAFAGKQEIKVIQNINATSKSYEEWLFNIKDESQALKLILIPILLELAQEQVDNTINFVTGERVVISDIHKQMIENRIQEISGVYNKDTIIALEKTLAEGQASGESLNKLKKRVENEFAAAKGYRAERIARTESLHTSNLSAEEAYRQSGFTQVEWFTNPGACEFCLTLQGQTKQIGGDFIPLGGVVESKEGNQMRVDYAMIDTPPLHPNCTCSLVPV